MFSVDAELTQDDLSVEKLSPLCTRLQFSSRDSPVDCSPITTEHPVSTFLLVKKKVFF